MQVPRPTPVSGLKEPAPAVATGEPRNTKISLRSPRNAAERALIDKLQRLIKQRGLAADELERADRVVITHIEKLRRAGMLVGERS